MIDSIDNWINQTTTYRMVLYFLLMLWAIAVVFGFLHWIPYSGLSIVLSAIFITFFCWLVNLIFAKIWNASTNVESVYISALIITLIITPPKTFHDLIFIFWISLWSMAAKYIFTINRAHIFNPVAFGVFFISLTLNFSAIWWVGNLPMLPFVLLGGLFLVRKLKQTELVSYFFLSATLTIFIFSIFTGTNPFLTVEKSFLYAPLFFFAFIMLTEPLTLPGRRKLRIFYAILAGFLIAPQIHFGSFYTTPEIALLLANIFSALVYSKRRVFLELRNRIQVAPDVYNFSFVPDSAFNFQAGQYLELTLPHKNPDNRGNRRYFTIASMPNKSTIDFGIKFYNRSSSFKQALLKRKLGDKLIASSLAGDFVLPKNQREKMVFIAGGIGITPFASIISHLVRMKEQRDIILIYSNRNRNDIAYKNILDQAEKNIGLKNIYTLTDLASIPADWIGEHGYLNFDLIKRHIPDYHERLFYISGPGKMVKSYEKLLRSMKVNKNQIKTDYFPGF